MFDSLVAAAGYDETETTDEIEIPMACEFKTATTEDSAKEASSNHEKNNFKKLEVIDLSNVEDCIKFKKLVPLIDYRAQVINHAAVFNLPWVCYVKASIKQILHVAFVHVPQQFLNDSYVPLMRHIVSKHVTPWYSTEDLSNINIFGYANDMETLKQQLRKTKALDNKFLSNNITPPQLKRILPCIIAYWNLCKGGQDIVSR